MILSTRKQEMLCSLALAHEPTRLLRDQPTSNADGRCLDLLGYFKSRKQREQLVCDEHRAEFITCNAFSTRMMTPMSRQLRLRTRSMSYTADTSPPAVFEVL